MITRYGVWKWRYFGGKLPFNPLYNPRREIYSNGVRVELCSILTHQECTLCWVLVWCITTGRNIVSQPVKWLCYHSPASDEPKSLISADLNFLICEISFLQIFFSVRSSLITLSRLYQLPVLRIVLIIFHSVYQILSCYLWYLFICLLSCSPNTKEAPERQIFCCFVHCYNLGV